METENRNQNKLWLRNFSLSILLHLLLIVAFIYLYGLQSNGAKINASFFTLDTKEYTVNKPDQTETIKENNINDEKKLLEKQKTNQIEESKTINFSDIKVDTTNLDQIYSEPTLNISIKFPKGWSFIDQNKKKKLDGVTFWANDGSYNPPPYIHLEVVDKDMFNEQRYSYKMDLEKFRAYYNDPEEMQGYVTQIIYIRTDDDEDFKLKLMLKGENEFKLFRPRFWAILKSFNFGNSLL